MAIHPLATLFHLIFVTYSGTFPYDHFYKIRPLFLSGDKFWSNPPYKLLNSNHIKGRFTRYDFATCILHTTRLQHFLGHNCRKVLKHVLKSYDFFHVIYACREGSMRRNRTV